MKMKYFLFVFCPLFIFYSCKKDETPDETPSVQSLLNNGSTPKELYDSGTPLDSLYGKSFQGGILAYLNVVDGTGLVSANADLSQVWSNWGCSGTDLTGAANTSMGGGAQNTTDILASCSDSNMPAQLCSDYAYGGYTDWYLPSKDELNALYTNLKAKGLGSFPDQQYWSSSEVDADNVWRQSFTDGSQYSTTKNLLAVQSNIRPVRSF